MMRIMGLTRNGRRFHKYLKSTLIRVDKSMDGLLVRMVKYDNDRITETLDYIDTFEMDLGDCMAGYDAVDKREGRIMRRVLKPTLDKMELCRKNLKSIQQLRGV